MGQVGAKNTKAFFPVARPRPPARAAAQEQTPLWPMPQTKEKNAKKIKTTARLHGPTNRPTTHNAARRHTQAIADTQRRENTQALGSHVFVGVRVLRARGCPDAPPQA